MAEKVYISDSDLNNYVRARRFENEGKWEEAKQLRKAMGNTLDVKAIEMIQEATRLGDAYRSLVVEADLYGKHERREINNEQLHSGLKECYDKIYS